MKEIDDWLISQGFIFNNNEYIKGKVTVIIDIPDKYLIESGKNKSGWFNTLIGLKRFYNKHCK